MTRIMITCALALVTAALASHSEAAGGIQLNVNCTKGSIGNALAQRVNTPGPITIFLDGVCNEDVTITRDDLTLSGNGSGTETGPGGAGTINGTIDIIGADRVRVEYLTISGPGDGIVVRATASADIVRSLITQNEKNGISVTQASSANLEGNLVTENGQPTPFFNCGLFVGDGSSVFSIGNTYSDNGYCAVEADRFGYFRNGSFVIRNQGPGTGPNPDERDTYSQGSGEVAIEVFNGGNIDLRNAEINGQVTIEAGSHFRFQTGAINGNVFATIGSLVRIENRPTTNPPLLTEFFGTLTCENQSQTFFSAVQCGQTCSGNIATTCVP